MGRRRARGKSGELDTGVGDMGVACATSGVGAKGEALGSARLVGAGVLSHVAAQADGTQAKERRKS